MSGSETGVMTSREPFTLGVQNTPTVQSQPVIQNIRLAYSADGTAVYKPVGGSSPPYQSSAAENSGGSGNNVGVSQNLNMNMGLGEPMKRKRGRPRKYGLDGSMALALSSAPPAVAVTQSGGGGGGTFSPPPPAPAPAPPSASPTGGGGGGSVALPSSSSLKKGRGRPPGSSKKQQMEALGSAGVGFTPHIISVKAGEDVSSKIMSFSQIGPRAVCVLSANGTISNVTLRQAATSGGTATYEGRFDILSLSGSFMLSEVGGQRSRTGGLSVSLAGPDGRVLGGCVAGLLTAASPVQVIVGSFIADGRKETKAVNQTEPLYVPHNLITPGGGGVATGGSSPPSRGTQSESSGSPLNQSTGGGGYNNNSNINSNAQGMSSMPWK